MMTVLATRDYCVSSPLLTVSSEFPKKKSGVVFLSISVFISYFPLNKSSAEFLIRIARDFSQVIYLQIFQALKQLKDLEKWVAEELKLFSAQLDGLALILAERSLLQDLGHKLGHTHESKLSTSVVINQTA